MLLLPHLSSSLTLSAISSRTDVCRKVRSDCIWGYMGYMGSYGFTWVIWVIWGYMGYMGYMGYT